MAVTLKKVILENVAELERCPQDELLERRYRRYRSIGEFASEPVKAASLGR
jgi:acetyl-CoA carboxylase alpha subunit